MALTKCRECGGRVSSKAPTCPSCGAPIKVAKKAMPGCGGCLAVAFIAAAGLFALLVISSNAPDYRPRSTGTHRKASQSTLQFPYTFVARKREAGGLQNVLELFAYGGEFDVARLK